MIDLVYFVMSWYLDEYLNGPNSQEWPRVFVNEQGKMSSLSVESERIPLFIGDVQSLLLFSLLGNKSFTMPR